MDRKKSVHLIISIAMAALLLVELLICLRVETHVASAKNSSADSEAVIGDSTGAVASSSEVRADSRENLEIAEGDLSDFVTGMDDLSVKAGSENIDYTGRIVYDSAVIRSIIADDSSVAEDTAGTYEVVYTVRVISGAYQAYREAKEGRGTFAELLAEKKGVQIETVKVTKKVEVLSSEAALDAADEGRVVLTDDGEVLNKSDGTEVQTEVKIPASVSVTGGRPVYASTGVEVTPEPTEAAGEETGEEEDAQAEDTQEDEDTSDSATQSENANTYYSRQNTSTYNNSTDSSGSNSNTSTGSAGTDTSGQNDSSTSGSTDASGGTSSGTDTSGSTSSGTDTSGDTGSGTDTSNDSSGVTSGDTPNGSDFITYGGNTSGTTDSGEGSSGTAAETE